MFKHPLKMPNLVRLTYKWNITTQKELNSPNSIIMDLIVLKESDSAASKY
jgi:hypothetical protein